MIVQQWTLGINPQQHRGIFATCDLSVIRHSFVFGVSFLGDAKYQLIAGEYLWRTSDITNKKVGHGEQISSGDSGGIWFQEHR